MDLNEFFKEHNKVALAFSGGVDSSYLLYAAIKSGAQVRMETIKSRPLPHVQFEYYFYVQLVCPANAATDDCAKLVHELENVCRTVRILGVFDL